MASKGKKSAAPASSSKKTSGGNAREEEQHQDPLQAVVLTEFFETSFAPLTLERPRVCYQSTCDLQFAWDYILVKLRN